MVISWLYFLQKCTGPQVAGANLGGPVNCQLSVRNSFYTELRPLVLKQISYLVCPIKESVLAYFLRSEKQIQKNHSTVVDTKIIHRVGFSVWILVTCFELVRGLGKHNFLKSLFTFQSLVGQKSITHWKVLHTQMASMLATWTAVTMFRFQMVRRWDSSFKHLTWRGLIQDAGRNKYVWSSLF